MFWGIWIIFKQSLIGFLKTEKQQVVSGQHFPWCNQHSLYLFSGYLNWMPVEEKVCGARRKSLSLDIMHLCPSTFWIRVRFFSIYILVLYFFSFCKYLLPCMERFPHFIQLKNCQVLFKFLKMNFWMLVLLIWGALYQSWNAVVFLKMATWTNNVQPKSAHSC